MGLSLRAWRDSFKCEVCKAADQSKPVEPEAAQKVKIGVHFATWWERTMAFGGVVRLFGEVRERDVGGERREEREIFL